VFDGISWTKFFDIIYKRTLQNDVPLRNITSKDERLIKLKMFPNRIRVGFGLKRKAEKSLKQKKIKIEKNMFWVQVLDGLFLVSEWPPLPTF